MLKPVQNRLGNLLANALPADSGSRLRPEGRSPKDQADYPSPVNLLRQSAVSVSLSTHYSFLVPRPSFLIPRSTADSPQFLLTKG
jgi:hypothetical protein